MTDESRSQQDADPGVPRRRNPAPTIDWSQIVGVQATVKELGGRLARQMNGAAIGQALAKQVPKDLFRIPEGYASRTVGERLHQAARDAARVQAYDFAQKLGRIADETRRAWAAQLPGLVKAFKSAWERIPANLRDIGLEDWEEIFRITAEDGTSLAWAPRTAIVEELLRASSMDARSTILVDRVREIADDVDASLSEISLPEHQELRSMLAEATSALRAGLYRPAQAAATAALDTLVNVRICGFLARSGPTTQFKARKHFRPLDVDAWEEADFEQASLILVGGGIPTAFEKWEPGVGHASFNRHGSTHRADEGAYSPAHAVRAVLIAQAALRWLDGAIVSERGGADAA